MVLYLLFPNPTALTTESFVLIHWEHSWTELNEAVYERLSLPTECQYLHISLQRC